MTHHHLSRGRLAAGAGLLALALAASSVAAGKTTPDAPAGEGPRTYAFQTLDYPGASLTIFWGLDDLGGLAGEYAMAGEQAHAMTNRRGRFAPLDPDELGTYFSAAGGPTDAGTTFGGYAD